MTYHSSADRLPLRPVNWNTVTSADNIGLWPPQPLSDRLQRLRLYRDLFDGLTGGVSDRALPVSLNYFQRVPTGIADLLTASVPIAPEEEMQGEIEEACYDGIVDMLRYGAALVWTNPFTSRIEILDPRYWAPTERGWYYLDPKYSIVDGSIDEALVYIQDGDVLTAQNRRFLGGSYIGEIVGEEFSEAAPDTLTMAIRTPRVKGWGTSIFDVLAPAIIEMSSRATANSTVLDKFVNPELFYSVAPENYTEIDPGAAGDMDPPDVDPSTGDMDMERVPQYLIDELERISEGDQNVIPPEVQNVSALTWDPHIGASQDQITLMMTMVEALSSNPGLFGGMTDTDPSGRALKILKLPFYVTSQSLQSRFITAMDESLELAGMPAGIEWEHIFDFLERTAPSPPPSAQPTSDRPGEENLG